MHSVMRALRSLPRPPYAEAGYWNTVYRKTWDEQGAIEWGAPPQALLHYQYTTPTAGDDVRAGALAEHAGPHADILVVGCGNSEMSEELARAGWEASRIHSVDFSATGIEQAATRARGSGDPRLAALQFRVTDCRVLHEAFPSNSFDCAIDKGLLDALYCSSSADQSVPATVRSILRVLRPGARYISLHSGSLFGLVAPAHLEELVADQRWGSLEVRKLLPRYYGLYLYIWTKADAGGKKARE